MAVNTGNSSSTRINGVFGYESDIIEIPDDHPRDCCGMPIGKVRLIYDNGDSRVYETETFLFRNGKWINAKDYYKQ